ncbi:MAG: ACT domain-containing protein [Candidatus Woesearchaeota archaeon]|nr:ACT domain-containing protein [Candidatus Woesearchaeota archaeon]
MAANFDNATMYASPGLYAMCTTEKPIIAFATIVDDTETTVICKEEEIPAGALKVEKGWKLLTLDITFDHNTTGICGAIGTALGDAGVSVMPLSAFSRDHFLVKEEKMDVAKEALKTIGITLQQR